VEFYNSKMKEAKDTASFNFGSQITAGNNVAVDSARDAVVIGSTVAAGNDVNIKAVRDTNLIPGLTAQASERRTKEKRIGFTALSITAPVRISIQRRSEWVAGRATAQRTGRPQALGC